MGLENLSAPIEKITGHTAGVQGTTNLRDLARGAVTFDTGLEAGSTLSIPNKQNGNGGVNL